MLTETPSGLDELIDVFGPVEVAANRIVRFALPYPLYYEGRPVARARCHELIVDNFVAAFEKIKALGLAEECKNYSGIYAQRSIRGASAHPSTHSWGIAIDLEAARYPLGSAKRFPEPIIKAFEDAGFFYGGNFKSRKDPMHWQFVTHY